MRLLVDAGWFGNLQWRGVGGQAGAVRRGCRAGAGGVAAPAMVRGVLLIVLLLGGCAGARGAWPSLAHRDGERDTGGPVCPACGLAVTAGAAVPPVAPAPPPPLPAAITAELAAIDAGIARIEAALPALLAARRAAGPGDADDRAIAAEVRRTRIEALVAPLADYDEQLDAIADRAAVTSGAAAVTARIADLKARIVAAQAAAGR